MWTDEQLANYHSLMPPGNRAELYRLARLGKAVEGVGRAGLERIHNAAAHDDDYSGEDFRALSILMAHAAWRTP